MSTKSPHFPLGGKVGQLSKKKRESALSISFVYRRKLPYIVITKFTSRSSRFKIPLLYFIISLLSSISDSFHYDSI